MQSTLSRKTPGSTWGTLAEVGEKVQEVGKDAEKHSGIGPMADSIGDKGRLHGQERGRVLVKNSKS